MKSFVRHIGISGCLLALGAIVTPGVARNGPPTTPVDVRASPQDLELDALLSAEARRVMQGVVRLEGQSTSGAVNATMNLATRDIVVDFSREFLPHEAEAPFEDQLDEFRHALMAASAPFLAAARVQYRFDGRDLFFYFPKLQEEDAHGREAEAARFGSGAGSAMVSAGHGYYRRLVKDIWVTQRDPRNGVLEDLITPLYAEELKGWLESRSQMPVFRPRTTSTDIHESSGRAWWEVAGRYHLEAQYPDNPEIWNSLGSGTSDDHHYKEDIRSRPLFANHHDADVAIHLHTNAAGPSATGTRVIYQTGREQSRLLASSILCYVRELVTAADAYHDFVVSAEAHPDNKGENRLAQMPSVIVEAAFHTNPDDALALQDPVFRAAAMKGVEKGYRLWREGKPCQPLAIQRVTDVTLPPHTVGEVEVHFEGHPRFPVTMEVTPLECPQDSTCDGGEEVKKEPLDSPLTFEIECGRGDHTRISLWQTVLRDDDGVASAAAQHRLTCTGPASAKEGHRARQARIGMW
ncbi:N-acetylmuramoyl-L-alanine amidase family protein [Stenotrophomonas tumulicola]|uniref:N-acetylmuramoyl-L-alanine amidase n=1 Tax=Stenotrophomonas tumulicola TaxID=1685415 RepID=A0A7W3FKG0_9GAMM|nr:N-acetylmuramoyl-L-alanine amidase [Stenotrophomonas tumulicola]MBA8681178.1 N-acetylmuramoyl-L-alanine amidase [Stenotrophomonas tumulicola]